MCSLSESPSRIIEPWRVNVFVNLFSWHIIFRGISDIFAHPLIINVSKVPRRICDWEVKRECNQYIGIYTSRWAFFFKIMTVGASIIIQKMLSLLKSSLELVWNCYWRQFTRFMGIPAELFPGMLCCAVTSAVSDSACLWTLALPAPLSMRFSRQEYWSGLCKVIADFFFNFILFLNFT